MKLIYSISKYAEYEEMGQSKLDIMGELSESTRMYPCIKDKKS